MLAGILVQARRNNAQADITGALICRQEMYLQLIEGPEDAIDRLYDKITVDDRHCEVRLGHTGAVDHRIFPDWAMLDDSEPGVTFACEGIADGAIVDATPQALQAAFAQIAAKQRG